MTRTSTQQPQLRLVFDSADHGREATPGLSPSSLDSLNYDPLPPLRRIELERRLLRLMDALENPQPRRRRSRFVRVGEIAA